MSETRWTQENIEKLFSEYSFDETTAAGKKRARILRAATHLFTEQGYRKTSVEQIARKAHIAKGTVYLYFEHKGALLLHAIVQEKKRMLERLGPLLRGEIPEPERLRAWLFIVFTSARDLPLSASLLRGDAELRAALEDIGQTELAARQSQGIEWVLELVERAAPGIFGEGEKRARAEVLIGLGYFSGLMLSEHVRQGRSLEEFAGTLADIVAYGVSRRPPVRDTE